MRFLWWIIAGTLWCCDGRALSGPEQYEIGDKVQYMGGGRYQGNVTWSPTDRLILFAVGEVEEVDPSHQYPLVVLFPTTYVRLLDTDVVPYPFRIARLGTCHTESNGNCTAISGLNLCTCASASLRIPYGGTLTSKEVAGGGYGPGCYESSITRDAFFNPHVHQTQSEPTAASEGSSFLCACDLLSCAAEREADRNLITPTLTVVPQDHAPKELPPPVTGTATLEVAPSDAPVADSTATVLPPVGSTATLFAPVSQDAVVLCTDINNANICKLKGNCTWNPKIGCSTECTSVRTLDACGKEAPLCSWDSTSGRCSAACNTRVHQAACTNGSLCTWDPSEGTCSKTCASLSRADCANRSNCEVTTSGCRLRCSGLHPESLCTFHSACAWGTNTVSCSTKCSTVNTAECNLSPSCVMDAKLCRADDCWNVTNCTEATDCREVPNGCRPDCTAVGSATGCQETAYCEWTGSTCIARCSVYNASRCTAEGCVWGSSRCVAAHTSPPSSDYNTLIYSLLAAALGLLLLLILLYCCWKNRNCIRKSRAKNKEPVVLAQYATEDSKVKLVSRKDRGVDNSEEGVSFDDNGTVLKEVTYHKGQRILIDQSGEKRDVPVCDEANIVAALQQAEKNGLISSFTIVDDAERTEPSLPEDEPDHVVRGGVAGDAQGEIFIPEITMEATSHGGEEHSGGSTNKSHPQQHGHGHGDPMHNMMNMQMMMMMQNMQERQNCQQCSGHNHHQTACGWAHAHDHPHAHSPVVCHHKNSRNRCVHEDYSSSEASTPVKRRRGHSHRRHRDVEYVTSPSGFRTPKAHRRYVSHTVLSDTEKETAYPSRDEEVWRLAREVHDIRVNLEHPVYVDTAVSMRMVPPKVQVEGIEHEAEHITSTPLAGPPSYVPPTPPHPMQGGECETHGDAIRLLKKATLDMQTMRRETEAWRGDEGAMVEENM